MCTISAHNVSVPGFLWDLLTVDGFQELNVNAGFVLLEADKGGTQLDVTTSCFDVFTEDGLVLPLADLTDPRLRKEALRTWIVINK